MILASCVGSIGMKLTAHGSPPAGTGIGWPPSLPSAYSNKICTATVNDNAIRFDAIMIDIPAWSRQMRGGLGQCPHTLRATRQLVIDSEHGKTSKLAFGSKKTVRIGYFCASAPVFSAMRSFSILPFGIARLHAGNTSIL